MKPRKSDGTPAWAIALLAAILDPEAARSQRRDKRGEAARRAQQFIDEVPKLLDPAFEDLSTAEMGLMLRDDSHERDALRESWGLSKSLRVVARESPRGDNLAFEDAIKEDWCRHKTRVNLVRFMERAGYPKYFIGSDEITRQAYQRAAGINEQAKRSRDAARKKQSRANQVSELNKRNRSRTKSPDSRTFNSNSRTV